MEGVCGVQKLDYLGMIEAINLVSLDFAIAIKQLAANQKHYTQENFNHCNKFYAVLLGINCEDIIVPFF
jgi:hypothetical protein